MDKSREQFEAYFIQYHLNDNPEMVELFLKRDGEGYKLPCPNDEWRMWQASRAAMEDEWRIWQASRAAVEIELPDVCAWNLCELLDKKYVVKAIRAAGLKVKGE
ncbi:hypothetical protein [Cronobacter sakazakii]|uniref:hypothetical protein n=1 Tax=Cronobacter sakazakii TaxID=28141 RepID=UPI0013756923|nr:hypothetical protein [Cronobacter sakazakii]NCH77976.1 hypothetical protein [Cronobacter sakazakii]